MNSRWLPRQGQPFTGLEKTVQNAVRFVAWLPVYIAIVTTLTLLVVMFGVPFLDGK